MRSEHGTPAAYQRHHRVGDPPCDDCLAAHAAYQRGIRERNPIVRRRQHRTQDARRRALARLAEEQPARFKVLYAEELSRCEAGRDV
jgi:hypothetical protein